MKRPNKDLWLAITLSVVVHIAVVFINPGILYAYKKPPVDTVVVDLMETMPDIQPLPPKIEQIPAPEPPKNASAQQVAVPNALPSTKNRVTLDEISTPPLKEQKQKPKSFEINSALPDPSDSAKEVTINLNDPDKRYKGFLDKVRTAVFRNWRGREAMLVAKSSGKVSVGFTLEADGGKATGLGVVESSNSKILDDEALNAIAISSFPTFPQNWKITRINLVGDFQYSYSQN